MPKEKNDIEIMKDEIQREAEALCGWDELKVISINKYGIEAVVKTDKGNVRMSMKDLFTQYFFILKIFETFGISLFKVKDKMYEVWRAEWAKTIVDMGGESGTSLDLLRELLESYIETAEDRDEAYLKKGEPIIINTGIIAFRSNEFSLWLKKKQNITYTNDQLHSALRDLECTPKMIGKSRIRAWVYKIKEIEEENLFNRET